MENEIKIKDFIEATKERINQLEDNQMSIGKDLEGIQEKLLLGLDTRLGLVEAWINLQIKEYDPIWCDTCEKRLSCAFYTAGEKCTQTKKKEWVDWKGSVGSSKTLKTHIFVDREDLIRWRDLLESWDEDKEVKYIEEVYKL